MALLPAVYTALEKLHLDQLGEFTIPYTAVLESGVITTAFHCAAEQPTRSNTGSLKGPHQGGGDGAAVATTFRHVYDCSVVNVAAGLGLRPEHVELDNQLQRTKRWSDVATMFCERVVASTSAAREHHTMVAVEYLTPPQTWNLLMRGASYLFPEDNTDETLAKSLRSHLAETHQRPRTMQQPMRSGILQTFENGHDDHVTGILLSWRRLQPTTVVIPETDDDKRRIVLTMTARRNPNPLSEGTITYPYQRCVTVDTGSTQLSDAVDPLPDELQRRVKKAAFVILRQLNGEAQSLIGAALLFRWAPASKQLFLLNAPLLQMKEDLVVFPPLAFATPASYCSHGGRRPRPKSEYIYEEDLVQEPDLHFRSSSPQRRSTAIIRASPSRDSNSKTHVLDSRDVRGQLEHCVDSILGALSKPAPRRQATPNVSHDTSSVQDHDATEDVYDQLLKAIVEDTETTRDQGDGKPKSRRRKELVPAIVKEGPLSHHSGRSRAAATVIEARRQQERSERAAAYALRMMEGDVALNDQVLETLGVSRKLRRKAAKVYCSEFPPLPGGGCPSDVLRQQAIDAGIVELTSKTQHLRECKSNDKNKRAATAFVVDCAAFSVSSSYRIGPKARRSCYTPEPLSLVRLGGDQPSSLTLSYLHRKSTPHFEPMPVAKDAKRAASTELAARRHAPLPRLDSSATPSPMKQLSETDLRSRPATDSPVSPQEVATTATKYAPHGLHEESAKWAQIPALTVSTPHPVDGPISSPTGLSLLRADAGGPWWTMSNHVALERLDAACDAHFMRSVDAVERFQFTVELAKSFMLQRDDPELRIWTELVIWAAEYISNLWYHLDMKGSLGSSPAQSAAATARLKLRGVKSSSELVAVFGLHPLVACRDIAGFAFGRPAVASESVVGNAKHAAEVELTPTAVRDEVAQQPRADEPLPLNDGSSLDAADRQEDGAQPITSAAEPPVEPGQKPEPECHPLEQLSPAVAAEITAHADMKNVGSLSVEKSPCPLFLIAFSTEVHDMLLRFLTSSSLSSKILPLRLANTRPEVVVQHTELLKSVEEELMGEESERLMLDDVMYCVGDMASHADSSVVGPSSLFAVALGGIPPVVDAEHRSHVWILTDLRCAYLDGLRKWLPA